MTQLGSACDDLRSDHPDIRGRRILFQDIALGGTRRPDQLDEIGAILQRCIKGPVSPEFMAPPLTRPMERELSPA